MSKRAFGLFRKMCGTENLRNVSIVTTKWGKVTIQEGESREMQLAEKYFKPALDEKAKMLRHKDTKESADQLLRAFLSNEAARLSLQKELVVDLKPLFNTEAGIHVENDLRELIRKAEEEAAEDSDAEERAKEDVGPKLKQYRLDMEEILRSRTDKPLDRSSVTQGPAETGHVTTDNTGSTGRLGSGGLISETEGEEDVAPCCSGRWWGNLWRSLVIR